MRYLAQDKIIYPLVAIVAFISIFAMNGLMISQAAGFMAYESSVTLNFVFLLGIWGYFTEWYAKKRKWDKRKSIIFYVVATALFFVLLRVGGMKTIFG